MVTSKKKFDKAVELITLCRKMRSRTDRVTHRNHLPNQIINEKHRLTK